MEPFPLFFNNSLPRSGSTLLQNLLAQNPAFHCTASNDLLNLLVHERDMWMSQASFMAQGLRHVKPRMRAILREKLRAFYEPEWAVGKAVFDKSRGWLQWLELVEEILERPIKVVVCVRDMRDVVASLEKIYRKSMLTDHPVGPEERIQMLTLRGRVERLLHPSKVIGYAAHSLMDVYDRGLSDRLVIVPYRELTHHPIETVRRVCAECDLTPFNCNPDKVEQLVAENDDVYGMELHTIRPVVEPDQGDAWTGVLPDDVAHVIDTQFAFIQRLARQRFTLRGA